MDRYHCAQKLQYCSLDPALMIGNEGAAERHDRRARDRGDGDVEARVSQAAEPWRSADRALQGGRADGCDRDVGRERHQQLCGAHADADFDQHMHGKRREDEKPPAPLGLSSSAQNSTTLGGQNGAKILSESVPTKNAASAPR